jgi:hypothetical protein
MATLGLARCTIDPANTEEVLAERATLVAATSDAAPRLIQARPAKADRTWIDVRRWDAPASAQAASVNASPIQEARPRLWQAGRRV